MSADIMFVNGVPFLITLSKGLRFATVEMLPNRRKATIVGALRNVHRVYKARSLKITELCMDGEAESLRHELMEMGIILNATTRAEHVGDIERYIRTVKERVRATYNVLPFAMLPTRILIELVYASVFWLNCFPATNGLSTTMSPRTMLTGFDIDYNKHCRLEFGAYAQVHEDHDNTMATRTSGAIALRPTGNRQGGY